MTGGGVLDAEVEHAAYGLWLYNGHDVAASLFGVSRQHFDPAVQTAARQAYEAVRGNPGLAAGWAQRFQRRLASELSAVRQRSA